MTDPSAAQQQAGGGRPEAGARDGAAGGPSRKAIVGWTLVMFAVVGLAIFTGTVLIPALKTRAVVARHMVRSPVFGASLSFASDSMELPYDAAASEAVAELGGPEQAAETLALFMRLPAPLASEKQRARAVTIAAHCGKPGVDAFVRVYQGASAGVKATILLTVSYCSPTPEQLAELVPRGLVDESMEVREAAAVVLNDDHRLKGVPRGVLVEAIRLGGSKARIVCSLRLVSGKGEKPAEAVPALIAALRDPHPDARYNACHALAKLGASDAQAVRAAAALLRDPNQEVRFNAAAALGFMGEVSVPEPPCWYTTRKKELPTRFGYFGFRDGGGRRRREIPGEWIKRAGPGPAGRPAIPELVKALGDGSPDVRRAVLGVLGGIGADACEAVPTVRKMLDDPEVESRACAIWALWMIEKKCPAEALEKLMGQGEDESAQRYAMSLTWLMKPEHPSFGRLVDLGLASKFAYVRYVAARLHVGGGRDAGRVIPVLIGLLGEKSAYLRADAARVLGKIGPRAAAALSTLEPLMAEEDYYVRSSAAVAYWRISGRGEKPLQAVWLPLITAHKPVSPHKVFEALETMGADAGAAIPALETYMRRFDDQSVVRAAAAHFKLGGDPEVAVRELLRLLAQKTHPRRQAVAQLGEMGAAARSAVPGLEKLKRRCEEEGDLDFAKAVAEALAKITGKTKEKR